MKHTLIMVNRLLEVLQDDPHRLNSEKDKQLARDLVNKILKYVDSLEKILSAHKEDKYLDRLHKVHAEMVRNWSDHVQQTFKKLEVLIVDVRKEAQKILWVIDNKPDDWPIACTDMAMVMVRTGLHDEIEDIDRLKKIEVFEIHELKEIIEDEEHLAELLDKF